MRFIGKFIFPLCLALAVMVCAITCGKDSTSNPSTDDDTGTGLTALPTSLNLQFGEINSVLITGGTKPYSFADSGDTQLVRVAWVNADSFSIFGVLTSTGGTDTIVVQDNASPRHTIRIPVSTQGPNTGSIQASWTINSAPANMYCPAGWQVRVYINNAVSTTINGTLGTVLLPNLTAGSYLVRLMLLDAGNTAMDSTTESQVVVAAGQVANVQLPDMRIPVGNIIVQWSVDGDYANGGQSGWSIRTRLDNAVMHQLRVPASLDTFRDVIAGTHDIWIYALSFDSSIFDSAGFTSITVAGNTTRIMQCMDLRTGIYCYAPTGPVGTVVASWNINGGNARTAYPMAGTSEANVYIRPAGFAGCTLECPPGDGEAYLRDISTGTQSFTIYLRSYSGGVLDSAVVSNVQVAQGAITQLRTVNLQRP